MKFLLDQNLSRHLARRLADLFPGSMHLSKFSLETGSDEDIWQHARDDGFAIMTKDSDFRDMSVIRGSPPKVLWLTVGNCSTVHIEALIRANHSTIVRWFADPDADLLELP